MPIKSAKTIRGYIFVLGLACIVLLFCGVSLASSFPFRAISQGDPLPALTFKAISDGSTLTTDSLKGTPSILVFWGADMETKKERSLKTFAALDEILPFLEEKKIKVLLVNAQGDAMDVIREVAGKETKIPAYTDETQKAYGELGIFVVPSVLIADKDGIVRFGLGYSHDFTDRLKGEVQVMLGEKTQEEVEKELRPEMKEKPAQEKQATRHFNLALVLMKRGQSDSAIEELEKALKLEPDMGEAQGQLGCLYLDKGMIEEAKGALDKSYEINPEYLPANICDAKILAEEGQVEVAIGDMRALLFRHARNPELHYALGNLYEKQEKFADAAEQYRKAFELVFKHVEFD